MSLKKSKGLEKNIKKNNQKIIEIQFDCEKGFKTKKINQKIIEIKFDCERNFKTKKI